MTKFTVLNHITGEPEGCHLTAEEAAAIILNHDGSDFEIREAEFEGDKIFELWTRKQVANKPWTKTVVFSFADTREEAEAEIFAEVLDARWDRHPVAMTDEEYERMANE